MSTDEERVVLRRSARGPLAGGGTVTLDVHLGARWIGWVYDTRRFTGSRYAGRRWLATWREDGDEHARWTSEECATRAAARDQLAAHVRAEGGAR